MKNVKKPFKLKLKLNYSSPLTTSQGTCHTVFLSLALCNIHLLRFMVVVVATHAVLDKANEIIIKYLILLNVNPSLIYF